MVTLISDVKGLAMKQTFTLSGSEGTTIGCVKKNTTKSGLLTCSNLHPIKAQ